MVVYTSITTLSFSLVFNCPLGFVFSAYTNGVSIQIRALCANQDSEKLEYTLLNIILQLTLFNTGIEGIRQTTNQYRLCAK